jgi:urease beta subunit
MEQRSDDSRWQVMQSIPRLNKSKVKRQDMHGKRFELLTTDSNVRFFPGDRRNIHKHAS